MSSQGPLSAGAAASDASYGANAWSGTGNVFASDNNYSQSSVTSGNDTQYLVLTQFGFTIPTGATIDSVVFEVERSKSALSGVVKDARVRVVKGGVVDAADKANTLLGWLTTDATATYTFTVPGDVALSPADVNATDFGLAFAAASGGTPGTPQVDYVRATVNYTDVAWAADQWSQAVVARPQPAPLRSVSQAVMRTEPTNVSAFDVASFPRCEVGRGGPPRPGMRSVTVGFAEPLSYATFDVATLARATSAQSPRQPLRPGRNGVFTPPIVEPTIAAPLDAGTVPPAITVARQAPPLSRGSTWIAYGKMVDPDTGEQEQPQMRVELARVGWARLQMAPANRSVVVNRVPQPESPAGFDAWVTRSVPPRLPRRRAGPGGASFLPEMSGPPPAFVRVSRPRIIPRRGSSRLTDPFDPPLPWPSRFGGVTARTVRPLPLARSCAANVHPTLAETRAFALVSAPRAPQRRGSTLTAYLPDFQREGFLAVPVVKTGRAAFRRGARALTASVFEVRAVGDVALLHPLVSRPLFWMTRAWWPRTLLAWCPQTISTVGRKDDRDGAGGGGNARSVTGSARRDLAKTGTPSQ